MAAPTAKPSDGAKVVTADQLDPELRKRVEDTFGNLEAKLGIAKEGERLAQYNAQRNADDDEDAAYQAFEEQRKAANRWSPLSAARAHRYGDEKALLKMGVKAGAEGTGSAGGYLVPEFYLTDRWIDVFRPAAIFRQLGPTTLTMPTHIEHVASLTADVTVGWAGENATLTDNEPTFGQVTFTAKKQYGYCIVSNELLQDTNPAVDAIIRQSLAKRLAIDETQQCLLGTGASNTPTGITNTSGVTQTTLATNGVSFSGPSGPSTASAFDYLIQGIYTLELNNVDGPYAFAFHPRTKQSMRQVKDQYGRNMWAINEPAVGSPGTIEGYSFGQTTLFPINLTVGTSSGVCSQAIVGSFENAWLMERMDMDWLVSNVAGTAFTADQTWIRVTRRWDFQLARPIAFNVLNGILV